jgi:hypothetical protein
MAGDPHMDCVEVNWLFKTFKDLNNSLGFLLIEYFYEVGHLDAPMFKYEMVNIGDVLKSHLRFGFWILYFKSILIKYVIWMFHTVSFSYIP